MRRDSHNCTTTTKETRVKPTERTTKTPHTATGLFVPFRALLRIEGSGASMFTSLLGVLVVATSALGLTVAVPATAGAYATIEGPPIYSSAPGLPDGRVYEQVSPVNKNGNSAGATTLPEAAGAIAGTTDHYGFAAADGDSVLFEGTGPMGEAATAINPYFVATKNRGAAGWSTHGVTPRVQQQLSEVAGNKLRYVDPSADLSHVMFRAKEGTYALPPGPSPTAPACGSGTNDGGQLYLAGADPFVPATWLERPSPELDEPLEDCGQFESGTPVGGTPDFSTVYFTTPDTLLPEDAERGPHARGRRIEEPPFGRLEVEAWGFYEDREGVLREAGVLPGGGLDPFGAVPAASGHERSDFGHEVSADGSRAFFVSPDPASCTYNGGQNNCTVDPPELYVRENGAKTVLVSRDTLLPEVAGLPATAPGGVLRMANPTSQNFGGGAVNGSEVFASPDGSQAFFQSEDQLTSGAPEGPPGNTTPKTYDFDLKTGVLTYLPGVEGRLMETGGDGSSLAFVKPAAGGSPAELDLWSAGSGGGSVTLVTQLPAAGGASGEVSVARMSSDGSVLVFLTASVLPGFNDGGTHGHEAAANEQIFRYDARSNALGCVSCAPRGITPNGSAVLSPLQNGGENLNGGLGVVPERGISADGDRIFFDTPIPLVPQDTNTGTVLESVNGGPIEYVSQGRDVYEWENGVVYLISTGKSTVNSYFLDNSENGDDVFFATAEGIAPGDTDGAYDIYDARVPHPGDNPPPAAVPCEGSVCQGPPNVPSPLTSPASATFSGLGNTAPEPAATPPPPKETTTKTVRCAKGKRLNHGKCVKKSRAKKSSKKKGK
jgi:hypothetical protein